MKSNRFVPAIYGVCIFILAIIAVVFVHLHKASIGRIHASNPITPAMLTNEMPITAWHLVGPFRFAGSGEPDNRRGAKHDFLADIGHPENSLNVKSIDSFCSKSTQCIAHDQASSVINIDRLFPESANSVIYAATDIESTTNGDVGLEYDYNQDITIWLNGELLRETSKTARIAVYKYKNCVTLRLKKGANLLVMKVDQEQVGKSGEPWELIASLMPIDQMYGKWLEKMDGWLLGSSLIKRGEGIHLNILDDKELTGRFSPFHVSIFDWKGTKVVSMNIESGGSNQIELPSLRDGYYHITLEVGNHLLRDAFYLGDTDTVYKSLLRLQKTISPRVQEYMQRDPIIQRYRILTSAEYSHPFDPNWQRKVLMAVNDGINSIHYPKHALWTHMPGMHLREFISNMDGTPQNYLLFLPHAMRKPLPVVMEMPYGLQIQRPFLKSALIKTFENQLEAQKAADLNGMAFVVIDGRGAVEDAPIGEADAFEVLNDLNENYSIDKSRLYLYGTCEGGARALLLAEHFPDIFAAVGVYGPPLRGFGTHGDVFMQVNKLSATPVIILKGELDDELTIDTLSEFHALVSMTGSTFESEVVQDGMHYPDHMEEKILPLLAKYTKVGNATPIMADVKESRSRAASH